MLLLKNIIIIITIIVSSSINGLIITKCINDKDVALTFEDGPSIQSTKRLLDVLDSLNVKSTFHVVTKHFNYPEVQSLITEIISRNHVLGYRLEAEWTMEGVSAEGVQGAVDYRLEKIKNICGKKPKFIRTSYNASEVVKNSLIASGLIVTVPNFETFDYKSDFDIFKMMSRFDSLSLKSAISVQREFSDNLIETTKLFIDHLRLNGYKIVTLQECTGIQEIYSNEKTIPPFKIQTQNEIPENNISPKIASSSSRSADITSLTFIIIGTLITMIFL